MQSRGLGGVLSIPQMRKLLLIGFLYVWGLGGVLTYYIPAAKSGGLTATQAAIGFTVVNITAAVSRIVWGRLADKSAGTRRMHVLRATGLVAAAAAVVMPIALATGVVTSFAATVVLAFGVFGFNGVLYLTAGEIAGADRAGRAVGLASMVVFGWGSLCAPVAGLAIEATGYDAVWAIAAITGLGGALVATSMLRSTTRPGERILGGWDGRPRALITLGGLLGAVVALTIGVNDIAVLTIGLSGADERRAGLSHEPAGRRSAAHGLRLGVLRVRRDDGRAGLRRAAAWGSTARAGCRPGSGSQRARWCWQARRPRSCCVPVPPEAD